MRTHKSKKHKSSSHKISKYESSSHKFPKHESSSHKYSKHKSSKRKYPEYVFTQHVKDYLRNRYLYDEKYDELFVFVGLNERKILIGECKQLIEVAYLPDLVYDYKKAYEKYRMMNVEVSRLFEEKAEIEDKIRYGRDGRFRQVMRRIWCNIMDVIYKDALPERNELANLVALLYFTISMK